MQHSDPRTTTHDAEDRRRLSDRREWPTRALRLPFTPRCRSGFRRQGTELNQFVDQMRPRVFLWGITIVVFCVIDAVLTLIHIERGGEELVPTMKWALDASHEAFVWIKLTLTGVGVAYLAVHQNFFVGKFCIRFVFFVYFFLMVYHAFIVVTRV